MAMAREHSSIKSANLGGGVGDGKNADTAGAGEGRFYLAESIN